MRRFGRRGSASTPTGFVLVDLDPGHQPAVDPRPALRRIAAETASNPAVHLALRAAPDVVTALRADTEALADLARRTGRPLMLRSDPALPPGSCAPEETHRA